MNAEPMPNGSHTDRLGNILADWLEAAENGQAPDEQDYLRRYPEYAAELQEHIAAWRQFPRLGGVGGLPQPAEVTVTPEGSGTGSAAPADGACVLDDYELLREIGRGGMGVVYEAWQRSLGRRVAVKILPLAATMDPRSLQRFKYEAQAAAQLDHPHIVHVYGVGCAQDVHYYAMQLVEGESLASLLSHLRRQQHASPTPPNAPTIDTAVPTPEVAAAEQTPPSALPAPTAMSEAAAVLLSGSGASRAEYYRTVAGWGIQAAEALEHAHQLGVVHRDIKPGNLLLDRSGQTWITDFGLARIGRDGELTRTGEVVGTLRYMSPEQALAKHGLVDHRCDIYALGATLYELLTLRPVNAAADCEAVLRQLACEEAQPPRRLDKGIPAELEIIVLKALEKNPAERYATAQELAEDLQRFLADEPIRARPAGVVRRVRKWGRRHKRALVFASGVLALAVVAMAASAVYVAAAYQGEKGERQKPQKAREKAEAAEQNEAAQRRKAEEERDTAERRTYLADMRLAGPCWEEGDVDRLKSLLEKHRPQAGRKDWRGWEWYYWQSLCHRELASLEGDGFATEVSVLAWSPTGRRLAWARAGDGTIIVWDESRRERLTIRGLRTEGGPFSSWLGARTDGGWRLLRLRLHVEVEAGRLAFGISSRSAPWPPSPRRRSLRRPSWRGPQIAGGWRFGQAEPSRYGTHRPRR